MSANAAGELWVVRHGETEWSASGRHTSTTDVPLTAAGEESARGLAARLSGTAFDLVLTSPRQRARRTAELAGFADAVVSADLVEWDYGDYEGITTAQIRESVPGWTVWSHPCPGGEDAARVTARLDRVVADVRARGGRVLVFGHGHASRALACRWLDQPVTEGRLFRLDTATVSVLGYERESPVVARWNA
ncbi:histidine phosphatase family protein [Nocardioides marmoriginsengisoli]|uniref:Histidine phosphatase family protein n=1 Tax=Nocardioides marmoriginsengisoli TaxID=661483 RepID=A0A3N0CRX0_9ACTN|nr:histidine phosphatase family protein [Nocardioides marmoriginsengisoli]RNL66207.1 histidine phosphatase family protein [Nocardioides marmoriginsengisoli]